MDESNGGASGFCPRCGQARNLSDRYCSRCGAEQTRADAEPSPSSGQPIADPVTPPTGAPNETSPYSAARRRWGVGRTLAVVGIGMVVLGAAVFGAITISQPSASKPANSSSKHHSTAHSPSNSPTVSYSSFEATYASLKGAVVKIETMGCDGNEYEGSGFAIDAHNIVTAGHVIEQSQSMTVAFGGNPIPAQIIGLDVSGDLALLHSDATIPGPYIPLETRDPSVGEDVAAIGYPLGGGLTMTQGSVSALNQDITVNDTNLKGLVQTDTPLNHGNSGGPLVALDGKANGIIDALNTDANGTGYALSPQYASVEVSSWIKSPEHHPLPMCSSSNPLGSVSTSSIPSAPTTGAGVAIPTITLTSQGTTSMYIVQSLASALATHQWDQGGPFTHSLSRTRSLPWTTAP